MATIVTLLLYLMISSNLSNNTTQEVTVISDDMTDSKKPYNPNDSFIVNYRQPVNGYKVRAVVHYSHIYDWNNASISFTKNGKSFILTTTSFGDSLFNKGGWGMDGTNEEIMKKYQKKTVEVNYHENREDGETFPIYTPFFFRDLDFDGIEELVIVHLSSGVRYSDEYDVYRIVDGKPILIDYPPYRTNDDFGMTDYPEFDYKKKTITCPYPEGELRRTGCKIYGISKKKKDIVVVNGKKHFFNHMEVIKEIKYEDE